MRSLAAITTTLALTAGCSNLNQKDHKRVESKDAAHAANGGAASVDHIVTLFKIASSCGTNPCPERPELQALMKTQPADVAVAALVCMTDPTAMTDAGVGLAALLYLDAWLDSKPDAAALQRTTAGLQRVIAEGPPNMRGAAYVILSERRLPDALPILLAELDNPARDASDQSALGAALGRLIGSFDTITTWMTSDRPAYWRAGLAAIHTFDLDGIDEARAAKERALTIALGKRADLPNDVVYDLAFFYDLYLDDDPDDPVVRPMVERWAKHADDTGANQMRNALVAHPSRRP